MECKRVEDSLLEFVVVGGFAYVYDEQCRKLLLLPFGILFLISANNLMAFFAKII